MKKIKTLCGVLALLCVGMMPVSAQNVLKFNADKKFKIVQFTDVHWVRETLPRKKRRSE